MNFEIDDVKACLKTSGRFTAIYRMIELQCEDLLELHTTLEAARAKVARLSAERDAPEGQVPDDANLAMRVGLEEIWYDKMNCCICCGHPKNAGCVNDCKLKGLLG